MTNLVAIEGHDGFSHRPYGKFDGVEGLTERGRRGNGNKDPFNGNSLSKGMMGSAVILGLGDILYHASTHTEMSQNDAVFAVSVALFLAGATVGAIDIAKKLK